MQRSISEDIFATLPMTPAQWRTEVQIKSTFIAHFDRGICQGAAR